MASKRSFWQSRLDNLKNGFLFFLPIAVIFIITERLFDFLGSVWGIKIFNVAFFDWLTNFLLSLGVIIGLGYLRGRSWFREFLRSIRNRLIQLITGNGTRFNVAPGAADSDPRAKLLFKEVYIRGTNELGILTGIEVNNGEDRAVVVLSTTPTPGVGQLRYPPLVDVIPTGRDFRGHAGRVVSFGGLTKQAPR